MMTYALRSALTLALLYSGFLVLLSRETLHRLNRLLLLFSLAASIVLPLVHVTVEHPLSQLLMSHETETTVEMATTENLPIAEYNTTEEHPIAIPTEADGEGVSWTDLLHHLYIIGLLLTLTALLVRTLALLRMLHGGLRHTDAQGNTVILKRGDLPSFSIFRYIVMSVGDYERHRHAILAHEQEHIRLHHTLDLLLLEAVRVVQWFNPFVYLLGRDLQAVHEYEADEAVIRQGIDAHQYQQLLVMKAVGNRLQPFANNLRRGSLKQRINMMERKKSPRWHALSAVFIIPAAALAVYAFASPASNGDEPEMLQLSALPESVSIDLRHAVLPTGSTAVTNGFGDYYGRPHTGIDLRLNTGDTIRAALDGRVATVENLPNTYGKYVILRHADGLETVYAHLSAQLVAESQEVRAGDPIGLGGSSGRSTGPHLHFETRLNGKAIDPALLFDFKSRRVVARTVNVDTCLTDLGSPGVVTVDGQEITTKSEFEKAVPDEKNIESVTVLGQTSATSLYGEKGKDGALIITTRHAPGGLPSDDAPGGLPAKDDPVFTTCEEMPKYEGGDAALMQLIARNIKYPEIAIEQGVQGRVIVKFIVEKDGTVSEPQVVRSLSDSPAVDTPPVTVTANGTTGNPEEQQQAERRRIAAEVMDAEAVRVVRLTYGHWMPGRQNGQPVRSWFTLPVTFRLN